MHLLSLFGLSDEGDLHVVADREEVRELLVPGTLDRLGALGLLPLCAYLLLRHPCWGDLQPEVQRRLQASLARQRAIALRLADGLELALAALARADVPVILLKGADLAFHVYPDPGLRDMLDLDILIPANRLEDASRALSETEFQEDTSCYSKEWYVGCMRQLPPLENEDGAVHLDVHGALFPPYSPFTQPEEAVWSASLPSGWPVARRLTREWAVWYLVAHAWIKHLPISGVRERLQVDLLALLARGEVEPIDWAGVVSIARDTGAAFALAPTVGALSRAPGVEALAPVAEEFKDLARAQRRKELGLRWTHRMRHLVPFAGLEGPVPEGAWIQQLKRPLRVLSALANRLR